MSTDRGTRVSHILTDARTVLSRARTAIEHAEAREAHRVEGYQWVSDPDPEETEVVGDLAKVVEILERWERTGRGAR